MAFYRADFECKSDKSIQIESDYYRADNDDEALRWAKDDEGRGVDFADIGHVEIELVQLYEVDGNKETFPEIRCVWY